MNGDRPTRELAAFVAALDADSIPRPVRDHAKLSMLDTVGCGLQGSTLEWSRIIQRLAASEGALGESTVWGTPRSDLGDASGMAERDGRARLRVRRRPHGRDVPPRVRHACRRARRSASESASAEARC